MGKFAVYTIFDNNYIVNGFALLYSFFKTNEWFDGDFFILTDDKYSILSDENKEKCKKFSSHIDFLEIKSDTFSPLMNNQKNICSEEKFLSCFYKLAVFLGKYDRVLWLDGDTLVLGNIRELFESEEYNGKFCACLDCVASNETFTKRSDRDYFNGGVYLVDKGFTNKYDFTRLYVFCSKVTKKELSSPRSRGKGNWVDQDCLNYYIKNEDVLIIPSMTYNANHCFGKGKGERAKIFHYYGPFNKPNGKMDMRGKDKWFFDPWHKMHDEAMKIVNKNNEK